MATKAKAPTLDSLMKDVPRRPIGPGDLQGEGKRNWDEFAARYKAGEFRDVAVTDLMPALRQLTGITVTPSAITGYLRKLRNGEA